MFGALRFLLALVVVVGHLIPAIRIGTYAVFGFFIISGYLMCRVMNAQYHFTLRGIASFTVNRILRIYPPYWMAGLLTVVLMVALDDRIADRFSHGSWTLPISLEGWIAAITLFGSYDSRWGLMPGAWALRVELVHYAAIALLLGRGAKIAVFWLIAAFGYHIYLGFVGASWQDRYFPVAATSLPFSVGAVIYHFRTSIRNHVTRPNMYLGIVVLLWLANAKLAGDRAPVHAALHFYLSCGIMAAMVLLLTIPRVVSDRVRALDSRLGDLAYPIYLLHFQTALLLYGTLSLPRRGPELTLFTLPVLLGASWLILRLVSDPVERLRERVKRSTHSSSR